MSTTTLGERIRNRRIELNLTQQDLADKMGYKSKTTINKIEMGINDIVQSKIIAFAKALDTTTSYLMGWTYEAAGEIAHANSTVCEEMVPFRYKKQIPILGRISAGLPVLAVEHTEGYENVEDESIDYGLIVKGDSMIGARIFEGDIVYVTRNSDIVNGDIVIALINGYDATIKRFYKYDNQIILKPENPTMKEQHYKPEEVRLLGKVTEAKIKLK